MSKKKSVKKNIFEKFSLREEYNNVFSYLKDSKKFIYFVISVFFAFALFGFFMPIPESVSKEFLDYFRQLVEQTKDFGVFKMIVFLFKNNVMASFMGLIFGVVLGIFPFFNTITNGFVLGYASKISVSENGIFSLWRLFPHGIFELPALFISLGLGVKLGLFMFDKKNSFKENFFKSLKTFVLVVVPLLIIAAIIEGSLIVLGK